MSIARRLAVVVSIIAAQLLIISYQVLPAIPPGIAPEDAKQIMRVSEVKRGMRGYGLTVFHGTLIEKFDVEVLGVLPKMNTGKDLIMVRIGGGPITRRGTGIIAGMSGSPCYIKGKLIGAIAYGSQFTKEPVGMITPIEDMLEAWDTNLPKNPSGYSSPQSLPNTVTVDGKQINKVAIERPGDPIIPRDSQTLRMVPLMMPLMVSGLSARGMGRLADVLRPFGIEPMAGPGAGGSASVKTKPQLVPGAAIGMSLARGDIDITGIGTVTYRRGSRILAMGHPMLGVGAIDAPMTTAFVTDLISSYAVSTKLAAPIENVGRIFQDRPWAIAGGIGVSSKTVPAVIRVEDETCRRTRVYRVNVVNHPLLAAGVLTTIVGEAVYQLHPSPGDATAEVSYEVTADQIGKVAHKNTFYDPSSIDSSAISDVGTLLALLTRNKFYPLDIKSLNVTVRIQARRDTATVDRIFVKKGEFEPGENVEVGVVLRPYKKDRITKTLSIKIPSTAPDGRVTLLVRGGATPAGAIMSAQSDEDGGAPAVISGSEMATADNVKQLIGKYLEREKNNELVVRLGMRSTAVNVAGEKLNGLPNTIAEIMKSSRNSGLRLERDEVKEVFDAGTIVYGGAQVSINVKRKDLKESKSGVRISSDSGSVSVEHSSDSSPVITESDSSDDDSMDADDPIELQAGVDLADEKPEVKEKKSDSLGSLAATDEDKADEKPAKEEKSESPKKPVDSRNDVKTVVRQPKIWMQTTQVDFAKGEFSGVSASSKNTLELVPTVRRIAETPEQFVWALAPAKDGVYAGTGNTGKIYHITDGGDMKVFYETGELEVHSLITDKAGNLYAGTSPNGKVFKIAPDGSGKEFWSAKERYILALAVDGKDNIYAGVGDAGKVYRIVPDGHGSIFTEVNEQQVLALFWDDARNSLLIGTGINGIVYKADASGHASPLFDAEEEAISSIVADSSGSIYAGTSSKGIVYKITPDGRSKSVLSKTSRILALARDPQDNIYAISDGNVVKITPKEVVVPLDSAKDKVQYLSLVYNNQTGALYAGTGNIGSVYVSKCCDISGTFESVVHDAGMISKWGKIRWTADTPDGTSVEVRTRAGNVPTPDSSWSGWSQPYAKSSGDQIAGDAARYIQFQVTLRTGKPTDSAKVTTVSISYMTPNQQPKLKVNAPKGGSVWAGKKTISWSGSDPDKDTLTYDGYYSADGGKQWKPLFGGISGVSGDSKPIEKKSAEEITAKVKSELDKSKDVPEDMKKQLLKNDSKDSKKPEADAPKDEAKAGDSSSKTSHELDSTKLPDGNYLIKIVASDKSSNATDALTGDAISEPFMVCNKPPKLAVAKSGVQTNATNQTTITGTASGTADVVGVQYRVDGKGWMSAAAGDGVFDSPEESFSVLTDAMVAGTHKIELQAVDAAGNASSDNVEVKIK